MRLVLCGVLAVIGLTATVGLVGAQEPDISVGADEMAFIGQVPAPPGTTVTIAYLDVPTAEAVECGRATSTDRGDSEVSDFVLVVARDCAEGDRQDPKVCWADDACTFVGFDDPAFRNFEGGAIREAGLLEARERETPDLPIAGGPGLPDTGGHDHASQRPWLLWAGILALAAGIGTGGAGFVLRRR